MSKGKMGFWTIVLFGINSIIGSGIFLLPNNAMSIIGPASLGVLLFDMLLVLAMTFCFAEASGLFKDNGGPYIYAKEAFGNFIGYEVGFLTWITRIMDYPHYCIFYHGRWLCHCFGRHYAGVKYASNEKHYCNRNFCTAGSYEPVWRAAL